MALLLDGVRHGLTRRIVDEATLVSKQMDENDLGSHIWIFAQPRLERDMEIAAISVSTTEVVAHEAAV